MGEEVFIDANIFLEIELQDVKSEQCKSFLQKVATGEVRACTSDFIVYSCLLQLQHKLSDTRYVERFLLALNSLEGLRVVRPSLAEMAEAAKLMKKYSLDFDDGLVVACMKSRDIDVLVSFDKDFDRVPIVQRKIL